MRRRMTTIPIRQTGKTATMSIAQNKKALHDYFIEDRYEAGLVLQGWEAKAIRAGRAQAVGNRGKLTVDGENCRESSLRCDLPPVRRYEGKLAEVGQGALKCSRTGGQGKRRPSRGNERRIAPPA